MRLPRLRSVSLRPCCHLHRPRIGQVHNLGTQGLGDGFQLKLADVFDKKLDVAGGRHHTVTGPLFTVFNLAEIGRAHV